MRKKIQTKIVKVRQAKKCYPITSKAKTFIYTAESVTPLIAAGKTPKIK
ncbi:MAG: hypothetical protein Q8N22_01345 [bacterium]|nr:hypothetical protein [bacterium]